jgi:hypothetical protein
MLTHGGKVPEVGFENFPNCGLQNARRRKEGHMISCMGQKEKKTTMII